MTTISFGVLIIAATAVLSLALDVSSDPKTPHYLKSPVVPIIGVVEGLPFLLLGGVLLGLDDYLHRMLRVLEDVAVQSRGGALPGSPRSRRQP